MKSDNDDNVFKKIKEIEEMTNFNLKKNICLNCLEHLVKERENVNSSIVNEITVLKNSLVSMTQDLESKEFDEVRNYKEEDLITEEDNLNQQLEQLRVQETASQEELEKLLNELSELHSEERNYWNVFNQLEEVSIKHDKQKEFTNNKYKSYESEIKQFSNTSLIDCLFNITCFDKYGVINGARLGFGSSIILDEINAGMGYIVFLTSIVAKKYSFEFSKYDLVPMGNYSKIVNKRTGLSYELNTTGISKVSTDKFNESLVMYLEALRELNDYLIINNKINQKTPEGDLNIKIGNEDINGYSIKYDYNYPDNWSQCMKFLLIVLKSYIYFILKKEDDNYREILDKAKILSSLNY